MTDDKSKILKLLQERYSKARPRGRDMKKLPKPYGCREAVFTCSNGWTIEKLPREDFPVEGFFMGHCLGGKHGPTQGEFYSLREADGTPHVTIEAGIYYALYGRCNQYPKADYVKLINEWLERIGEITKDPNGRNTWGKDEDEEYHVSGKLNDKDYRDLDRGFAWRDEKWTEKRNKETDKEVSRV